MLQTIYIGIDPGQSGGIAIISPTGNMSIHKMPPTEHDTNVILEKVAIYCAHHNSPPYCLIEGVHSFPGQGVSSSFKFGRNYGFLRGVLVANKIPFNEVSPQKWQKFFGLQKKSKEESKTVHKNRIKEKAQQLHPELKITLATSDAVIICEYCRQINK